MIGTTTDPTQAADQMQAGAQQPSPAVPQPTPVQPTPTPGTQTIPSEAQPQPTPVPAPRRTGLAGIVDEMRDALTGGQGGWGKVAAEALTGAAAGYAQRGRGRAGQAALAGVEQGEHLNELQQQHEDRQRAQAQQDLQNKRQATLDQYNFVKLQHDIAASDFELSQRKVEATRSEIQFAQQQSDRQHALQSTDLGSYPNYADFTKVQERDPDFWKNTFGARVVAIPEFDENGNRDGIHVWLQQPDAGDQPAPKDSVLWVFTPPGEGEQPKLVPHTISVPMTVNALTQRNQAFYKQYQDFVKTQADAADKASQEKLREAQTGAAQAERVERLANAHEANVKAAGEALPAGSTGVQDDIAEGLASGRYLMGKDLPLRTVKDQATAAQYTKAADDYSRKTYGLPYSPELIRQESKMAESPRTQAFLNGIDRMVGTPGMPGQLDQVLDLAKRAGIVQKGGGLKVTMSQLNQWVQQHMGVDAAKQFQSTLSDTQTALGSLIGNPLLGSGESDLKLKTAQAQFGKDASVENLAGTIATTKEILERARAELARNNRYIQQRYGDSYSPTAKPEGTPNAGAEKVQPGEPTVTMPDGSLRVVRNGQWVPAQQ